MLRFYSFLLAGFIFAFAATFSQPAAAQIYIHIGGKAGKETLTVINQGFCSVKRSIVRIDLSESRSNLLFKPVTRSGSLFLPMGAGGRSVHQAKATGPGRFLDQELALEVDALEPGQGFQVQIDLERYASVRSMNQSAGGARAIWEDMKSGEKASSLIASNGATQLFIPSC